MPRIVFKELDTEQTHVVAESDALIGRDPASAFVIDGPKSQVVSSRHARIYVQDGSWWIEDMSRNGTVVDHERLQRGVRHVLKAGQVLGLGDTGPRYTIVEAETRFVAQTLIEGAAAPSPRRMPTPPRPTAPVFAVPELATAPSVPRAQPVAARPAAQPVAELGTEPMAPSPDWIVHMVLRSAADNRRYDVRGDVIKIGRGPVCIVQIPADQGASVSRVHAEVCIQDGGVSLRDAGSRNGTFLNGKRLDAPQQCAKGDQIMLGAAGPTLSVEDLHIVKPESLPPEPPRETPIESNKSTPPGGVRSSAAGPGAGGAVKRALAPAANLARRSLGVGRTSVSEDGAQNPSGAGRGRAVVWSSALGVIVLAVLVVGMMQSRVSHAAQVRTDSLQHVAAGQAARLRVSVDSARAANAPASVVDSLRNELADATKRSRP
jgi:pSer/pThr/pTyr-binding forkhead associated (FHA) protein